MSLVPTDEQKMIEESVAALLADTTLTHGGGRLLLWGRFAELGLHAMPFSEEDGGLGSSFSDQMVVARVIGRFALDLPFISQSVLAAQLVAKSPPSVERTRRLAQMAAGQRLVVLAHNEPHSRYMLDSVETIAEPVEAGFILSGTKGFVLQGDVAHEFLVTTWNGESNRLCLFAVPANSGGLLISPNPDGAVAAGATLILANVFVPFSGLLIADVDELLHDAIDCGMVACINEAVGAMERLLDVTVEYLKTRKQFGAALGSFQSLQHAAVDMYVELEQARSMAIYATTLLAADSLVHNRTGILAAKLLVNKAARFVGESAVQLHGGIGMTIESEAGRLFRRLCAYQLMFADTEHCLDELGTAETSILED